MNVRVKYNLQDTQEASTAQRTVNVVAKHHEKWQSMMYAMVACGCTMENIFSFDLIL